MILFVAILVFMIVVTLIAGGWWVRSRGRDVRQRVMAHASTRTTDDLLLERRQPSPLETLIRKSDLLGRLTRLSEQAGRRQSATDLLLLLVVFAVLGAAFGAWRIGSAGGALLCAIAAGGLPVLHLLWRRSRRIKTLEEQFADAVDMIARSIRAGNALSAAINLVAEEMPEPTRAEFARVADEVRLGMDPSEALARLQERISSEDVRFFCSAVNIQRGSGGNLAEVLDRLSEVIRKRFELLSHARVLSAQQRYSAIFVGVSPVAFSVLFYFISPGYFDPLLASPNAGLLIGSGLVLEAIGFGVIWRLAQIKV